MKIIGIAGYARCGKDTFVGIARKILERNHYNTYRIAFADDLKTEAEAMLKANGFSATVYTEDAEKKKLIRPLLVWWGMQRRHESEGGLYWVKKVDAWLRSVKERGTGVTDLDKMVFLSSDVRFVNEVKWVQKDWDGVVIHLKRYTLTDDDRFNSRQYDPAPNEEEAKNDPLVQELADHHVEWESAKKMTAAEAIEDPQLQKVVLKALNATKYFNGTLS